MSAATRSLVLLINRGITETDLLQALDLLFGNAVQYQDRIRP